MFSAGINDTYNEEIDYNSMPGEDSSGEFQLSVPTTTIYPAKYNRQYSAVMSNKIIMAKQDLNLREIKLVRYLITQVVKEDTQLKTYSCKITSLARFLGIAPDSLYRDMPNICKSLMKKVIEIEDENVGQGKRRRWLMFHWLDVAKYDGNGTVIFKLSDEISPFLLALDSYFTSVKGYEFADMDSQYGVRLFEILKSQDYGQGKENQEFTIKSLRHLFACENKYKTTAEFLRYTIYPAVEEINNMTNLSLKAAPVRINGGKSQIESMKFTLTWFNTIEEKTKRLEWEDSNKKTLENFSDNKNPVPALA